MILEAVQAINNCMFRLEYGNLKLTNADDTALRLASIVGVRVR